MDTHGHVQFREDRAGGGSQPAMSTINPSIVQALYAHIHRLLDEYVAVHLTTDYVDCTQSRVFQVSITKSNTMETDLVLCLLDTHRWSAASLCR